MTSHLRTLGGITLAVLLLPLIVVWLAGYLFWLCVRGGILRVWFWRAHAVHGRRVLFVYSNSPNWQAYIESSILPQLREQAVVLNWSERRLWSSLCPWEARYFRHFAGMQHFNPMAIVFCPGGRIRSVRFHQAFLDFIHGKPIPLREAEEELFSLIPTGV